MKIRVSRKIVFIVCIGILSILILLAWSPWITEEYAEKTVDDWMYDRWKDVVDGCSWEIEDSFRVPFGVVVVLHIRAGFPGAGNFTGKYLVSSLGMVSQIGELVKESG